MKLLNLTEKALRRDLDPRLVAMPIWRAQVGDGHQSRRYSVTNTSMVNSPSAAGVPSAVLTNRQQP